MLHRRSYQSTGSLEHSSRESTAWYSRMCLYTQVGLSIYLVFLSEDYSWLPRTRHLDLQTGFSDIHTDSLSVYIDFKVDVLACFSTTVWTTFVTVAQMTGVAQIEFDPVRNLAFPAPTSTYDSRALVGTAIQAAMDFPSLKKLLVFDPRMYWAKTAPTSVTSLDRQELRDLVTLHRQMIFCGVDRGKYWEVSEVEIVTEGVMRPRYPDH